MTKYTYQSGIFGQGRLLNTLTDAKSQSTTFGYDTRGRVTSVTNPLGQSRYYEEKRKGDAFYYLTIVDKHSISKNRP